MARVCPQQVYISCPETCEVQPPPTCYREPEPECPEEQPTYNNNFANYCDEGSGDEEEIVEHRRKKRRRSSNESSMSAAPPPPPPMRMMEAPMEPEKSSGFCSCDGAAMLIILAFILAVGILALAVWCYIQDSSWNDVVHKRTPFPDLEGENFIGGHYLYMYEDASPHLQMAKKFLLRENRWLELIHIGFFTVFIIFTAIQLATYLTRGKEDHSRVVICYYAVFGGLGIIVALFPMLSWNQQDTYYDITSKSLKTFTEHLIANPTTGLEYGVTNATGYDARTIIKIMRFCSSTSADGITIDESTQSLKLFKRDYTLKEFQTLGFCTHHKFKIANTLLSFIFAFVCCAVPCVFCFGDRDEGFAKPPPRRPPPYVQPLPAQPPMRPQPQPPMRPQPKEPQRKEPQREEPQREEPPQQQRKRSVDMNTVDEVKKFKKYVEAGTDEEKTFDDHHHFK